MIKDGWQCDSQILAWLLSHDKQHSAETLAVCAASAAAAISEVLSTIFISECLCLIDIVVGVEVDSSFCSHGSSRSVAHQQRYGY
jgi:hypothetical protein